MRKWFLLSKNDKNFKPAKKLEISMKERKTSFFLRLQVAQENKFEDVNNNKQFFSQIFFVA